MSQLGERFSLSHLLSPLPSTVADEVVELLSVVSVPLAAPALQAVVGGRRGIHMSDQAAKNVVWQF